MGIRKKILLYFSLTSISLTGVALIFIYTLFAEYREEEFQQRQKEKIKSTLFFLSEIKKADNELTEAIDRLSINNLYNEKLLIFNHKKELIYSSIDDTPIQYSKSILDELSEKNEFLESLVIKFSDKRNIKEFIIAKEILDKPLALRKYGKRIYA